MKNKNLINPIGLKGNEIHERQLALMGIKPLNENENKSNHAVELTKVGPDGNAYAIVRENHEYYIKKTDKTTGLVLEDFKYIGGLQNKKSEAYPSYAKAIKQLNLKFKSLSESYNKGGDINVFEDDNLLEHHPLKSDQGFSEKKGLGDNQEYVVDKAGTPLTNKAKEGKEEGQFGDNVADKDAADEFEKVKLKEGFGFTGEGNLDGNKAYMGDDMELTEEEMAIQEMIDRYTEEEELSDKQKDLAALRGGAELKEDNLDHLKNTADYHKRVKDLYSSEHTKNLSDTHNAELELALNDKVAELQSIITNYENIVNVSGSENFAAIDNIKQSIIDLNDQILSLTQKYGNSSESSLTETIAKLEEITMSSNKVYDSMSVDALEKVLDFYRDLYRNSNGNENIKNLMDDTQNKLRVLKTPTTSVKSDVGPYGHSLEESINRLDTLLDGELKKKAKTLTKKK